MLTSSFCHRGFFISQSTVKSCMALSQCGHCIQSFVLLRAEVSGTLHLTTTQDKGFLGLAPIQAPLPSNFSYFKTQSFAYSFCSSLAYHSKLVHAAHIAVFHVTTHVQHFLFSKLLVTFLPQCLLCWSIANKHILFNRIHLSYTITCPCQTQNTTQHLMLQRMYQKGWCNNMTYQLCNNELSFPYAHNRDWSYTLNTQGLLVSLVKFPLFITYLRMISVN